MPLGEVFRRKVTVVDETSGVEESIILSGRHFCWFLCKRVVFTKSLGILLSYAIFEIRYAGVWMETFVFLSFSLLIECKNSELACCMLDL